MTEYHPPIYILKTIVMIYPLHPSNKKQRGSPPNLPIISKLDVIDKAV